MIEMSHIAYLLPTASHRTYILFIPQYKKSKFSTICIRFHLPWLYCINVISSSYVAPLAPSNNRFNAPLMLSGENTSFGDVLWSNNFSPISWASCKTLRETTSDTIAVFIWLINNISCTEDAAANERCELWKFHSGSVNDIRRLELLWYKWVKLHSYYLLK